MVETNPCYQYLRIEHQLWIAKKSLDRPASELWDVLGYFQQESYFLYVRWT